MKEYVELYLAIWDRAVEDDINKVVKILYAIGIDEAYDLFRLKLVMAKQKMIKKEDKKLDEFKKELLKSCRVKTKAIEQRIKELVYEEEQDWPNNGNYKSRDEQYNQILGRLEQEIEEYAAEKMEKEWEKISKEV